MANQIPSEHIHTGPNTARRHAERPPRISGHLQAETVTREGGALCRVRDLSLTGLFLDELRVPVGTEVPVALCLPNEPEPLEIIGRVVREDGDPRPGVALTFSRIGWEDILAVARYLAPRL